MCPQDLNPVHLNNLAVRQMEDGDFLSANQLFKVALSLMVLPENKRVAVPATKTIFSWSKDAPIPVIQHADESIGTFLFSRAVIIKSTGVSRECKAAILYNSALVAHLVAMAGKPIDASLLRRAKLLYSLSRTVLKKFQRSALLHKLFIHMAILNNLGQLSYELADYECCRCCFEHLHKIIRCLNKACCGVYCKRELLGMVRNATLETPITAPCA